MSQQIWLWDGKGYHNVHAHTTETGGNGCTTKVFIIDREQQVEGRERGLPTATGGGVLAAATGSHVTSPGRRATA
jgi:hypothetical protein